MTTTAEIEIQIYFNLIHNILCNEFGIERIDNLERKSAYVPMSVPEEFRGEIEVPAEVYLHFGEHQVDFGLLEQRLREHYEIGPEDPVKMTLPAHAVGTIHGPVGTWMLLVYETTFDD